MGYVPARRFLVVALAAVVAAGACVDDSTNPFPTTAVTTASDTAPVESAVTSSGTSGAADSASPTSMLRFDGGGLSDPAAIVMAPSLSQQPAGVPFSDPAFGFTLQRVSNLSDTGGYESHIYSQLQAFSADGHYLLLTGSEGYVVRRTADFTILSGLDTSEWNVPRWHPTMAHTVVHFDTNADSDVTLELTDVETLDTSQVMTLPDVYGAIVNDQSFDELSEDGRWLAGMVVADNGEPVMFSLDLGQATLGTVIPISELYAQACQPDPEWGQMEPDWIGVSPLGNFMMVQWVGDGTSRCSGLEAFDLSTGEFIAQTYDGHQHGDLGVDNDGTEFFMTFEEWSPADNDRPALAMRRLPGPSDSDGPVYLQVLDWADDGHISCQGPPGVCLVTYGGWDDDGRTPFQGELFLQYTDGRVLRLAHHRSSSCGYWVQPRASISKDGTRVVFASDWTEGTGSDSCTDSDLGRGDTYLLYLSE